MKTFDEERRMVPRWRTFSEAIHRQELSSLGTRQLSRSDVEQSWVREKDSLFDRDPSAVSAFELLSAAIIADRDVAAKKAARFLLRSPEVGVRVQRFSRAVLDGEEMEGEEFPLAGRLAIAKRRAWLIDHPQDSVVWTELALWFSYVARREKARRCIETALALSPTNRYVVRSATRFFVHEHEPERALFVLDRSRKLLRDPWVAAAGLAVMEILGRRPKNIRAVRSLLDADTGDRSLSELRGALGSLEYRDGSRRRARKLFVDSLKDASENALAHLSWYQAKNRILLNIPSELGDVEGDYEGKVWRSAADKDWQNAIALCENWAGTERYSSRPYVLASYWACVTEDDLSVGKKFALQGLQANPKHPTLLNNLAFACGRLGLLEEGQVYYRRARQALRKSNDDVSLWALDGLWAYRKGDSSQGRFCYGQAIKLSSKANEGEVSYRLALHWMEEELDRNADGVGAVALAVVNSSRCPDDAEILAMRSRIETKSQNLERSPGDKELISALRAVNIISG